MIKMVEFYLTRHGETEENVAHILQGHMPGRLTERGKEQAAELRETLAGLHVDFHLILSSPLRRAVDTVDIINEAFHLPVEFVPLLCERDWGSLTGTVVPSCGINNMPEDVESVEAMFLRATRFLQLLWDEYEGKKILVVAHGLFNRVIQAVLRGVTIRDVQPMRNAEYRCFHLTSWPELESLASKHSSSDSVSAS